MTKELEELIKEYEQLRIHKFYFEAAEGAQYFAEREQRQANEKKLSEVFNKINEMSAEHAQAL